MKRLSFSFCLIVAALAAQAQVPRPTTDGPLAAVETGKSGTAPGANGFAPSWDTQKHARTYVLNIPAPRGQIVDRNGSPLAQTRVSYNLAINFPTPTTFKDAE